MPDISRRLQVVRLGGFDQGIASRTGVGALRRVGEQPGFAANGEGADGILGQHVANVQVATFAVSDQCWPLLQRVLYRVTRLEALGDSARVIVKSGVYPSGSAPD